MSYKTNTGLNAYAGQEFSFPFTGEVEGWECSSAAGVLA